MVAGLEKRDERYGGLTKVIGKTRIHLRLIVIINETENSELLN